MAIYKRHLGRSTIQYNAMQCNTMQCNTIQYNTGLFMTISKKIQQAARFIFVFALS